jgi:hypothetical protein
MIMGQLRTANKRHKRALAAKTSKVAETAPVATAKPAKNKAA